MRKKKKGHIVSIGLAALLVMSVGTVCRADYGAHSYDVTQYSYDDYYDNVSSFTQKESYSSMRVMCGDSTAQFRVSALGSNGDGYADCSGGYRYFINQGDMVDEMINFVRENGYYWAGIKGEYMFEEFFHASGYFWADI